MTTYQTPTAAHAPASPPKHPLLSVAMVAYRQLHPHSRRIFPTAIIHSGGRQTIRDCICGSRHTESTRHRGRTKHVKEWLERHADCDKAWYLSDAGHAALVQAGVR